MAESTHDADNAGDLLHKQCNPHQRGNRDLDLPISCTLNTEVGAVLAAIRRTPDLIPPGVPKSDSCNSHFVRSLQSLRSLIFHPLRGSWRSTDPAVYLNPFLEIIQSEVSATATNASLYAVLKIIRLNIFGELTPGSREAIHAVVFAATNCRLEATDPASEDAILMRILQLLVALVYSNASVLLTDHAICTVVSSCFQIVQQSASRSDLLQCSAQYAMHDIIQAVFSHLPEMRSSDGGQHDYNLDIEDDAIHLSYTAQCMVDIFHFLCSLINVVEPTNAEASNACFNEEILIFTLTLINSAIELGGDSISRHPGLLNIIQDHLFYHLIHYGTRSGPLVLSVICSIVLNLYHCLRRSLRLQLEAFFIFVLLKITGSNYESQLQEVAIEAVFSFCRQPKFIMEMYVNYDCDPLRHNVMEEIGKLLCKKAFPMSSPTPSMQTQAFDGLITVIHNLADGAEIDRTLTRDAYVIDDSEFKPFWQERCDADKDPDSWVEFVRMRKLKKKKIIMAANHYNRDEKKGLDFLSICRLVPNPLDAKSLACFFRYTPRLDKNKIGDYLGELNDFNIKVLNEFVETFEFGGVNLDIALRTFLETFRLPGESQKIQRILEIFSERFYKQQSSGICASKDVVFILCYSLIMLNTDQHNPQVKKKMTEEEFIRNNRAINGGMDLPREYLLELFHSISTNPITLFGVSNGVNPDLNHNIWANLIKWSHITEPFIQCDYKHILCREIFITISGLSIATICSTFEHTDDEALLQECIEGLISISRITKYSLEDILDELLSCFCKFTMLLNPYAAAEETIFTFTNEIKPRMAIFTTFMIANKFGESIRGAWRSIIDCLLKLKRLNLLPHSLLKTDSGATKDNKDDNGRSHSKFESKSRVIFSSFQPGNGTRNMSGLVGRFSQFLELESNAESMLAVGTEMEKNAKLIQQCQIGSIFINSGRLSEDSLQHLIRALVFAAAGKGQKFSTPVEEDETVGFCWDLTLIITMKNLHRFESFWSHFHESLAVASQFPLFSPCPFAEKAMLALLRVAAKILSEPPRPQNRQLEEMMFKSINLTWKLDKEIVDMCIESIAEVTMTILNQHADSVQTTIGWKTLLHLLTLIGRRPENYDRGVETIISLLMESDRITKSNYIYCIESAFGFVALKISPLETSSRILNLMVESVKWIIQWQKSSFSDPGSSSSEEGLHNKGSECLFMRLTEALRKTTLVRREEIRNQAVEAVSRCFLTAADELDWTTETCASCFNLVIFAMVDDLHEKMIDYSRREGMNREMRSMEGTLTRALEKMTEVYLRFLDRLMIGPGFRTFWLGLLRRMDTCMKSRVGDELQENVPGLLKRMILEMMKKKVLVPSDDNDLWEVTNVQIQWIAPSLKELFL